MTFHTPSEPLRRALNLPNGARFYKCALQVNPFTYLQRHNKQTTFTSEEAYNQTIVTACQDQGIEVIAVTDHFRFKDSAGLITAARSAGVHVFPGFEAVSSDGVHLLCLFDEGKEEVMERIIGNCGITDALATSPLSTQDCVALLESINNAEGICIAAHVSSKGGLLQTLSGQPRINAWQSPYLYAASLPGPADQAPQEQRPILLNKNHDYHRDRPIAVINAQDVNCPEDLGNSKSVCQIKMTEVTVEGLRQAFLDPDSRIRLLTEEPPSPHAEFLAMTWAGGFLDGSSIHFNENLNVLVGGRGTGKSTIIESLRYVLNLHPLGEDAKKAHEGVVKHVLKGGTRVSLLVRSHKPSKRYYTIERTVPDPPTVKDANGDVLALTPGEVMPGVELFGQHEIAELAKDPMKLARLLERFRQTDLVSQNRKAEVRRKLERSRSQILEAQREQQVIEERLNTLPGLEEMMKRFVEADLENRLKGMSQLVREEKILTSARERLAPFEEVYEGFLGNLPIDTTFLSGKALEGLPNTPLLAKAAPILEGLSEKLSAAAKSIRKELDQAVLEIESLHTDWKLKREQAQEEYEKTLRDLQKEKIDGAEFIQLRKQIETLRPLKEKLDSVQRGIAAFETERRNLVNEWSELLERETRSLDKAARDVSKKLAKQAKVEIHSRGNREHLCKLLRDRVGGNLAAVETRLSNLEDISLVQLSSSIRGGKDSLIKDFSFSPAAAERIAQGGWDLAMQVEEVELPPRANIQLNVSVDKDNPEWKNLDQLSTGQKATAVLLLLLLESETPLVVDQPEDDLDNRFIAEGVVGIMKKEKQQRQFVFSTHNANIPVLGDAELILGLSASGDAKAGSAKIPPEHMGSIDTKAVKDLVGEILEGGKAAFDMRRVKYGF